jgi:hypothetical protein
VVGSVLGSLVGSAAEEGIDELGSTTGGVVGTVEDEASAILAMW